VADLIPQLQRRLPLRETLSQVLWIAAGLGMIMLATGALRGHAH
jgi:zinc and cadmium transporter